MNAQERHDALLARLADIDPPPVPDWTVVYWLCAMGAGLALIAIVTWLLRRHKDTPPLPINTQALKKLKHLEQMWQQGAYSERDTAYQDPVM